MSVAFDVNAEAAKRLTHPVPLLLPEEYNPAGWTHVYSRPQSKARARMSRAADLAGSVVLLALTLPVIIVAAIAVKLTSRGPIIFKQHRSGLLGRPFTMYKLRSMRKDAHEEKLEFLRAEGLNGPTFKLKRDPRVTRVGAFLRKTSIDELPQLVNVLLGHMTLVGPRPLPLHQIRLDRFSERSRLSVKPGITGLWQISGRADIPYDEWIELDLYYVQHQSLTLDFHILMRTIPAVISGRGAY